MRSWRGLVQLPAQGRWIGGGKDLIIPTHLRVRPFLHNLSYLTSDHRPLRKDDKGLILRHMIDRNVPFTSIVTVRRIEFCSCTPVRYTPMRHTPMRYTPMRCSKKALGKTSSSPILQTLVRWS